MQYLPCRVPGIVVVATSCLPQLSIIHVTIYGQFIPPYRKKKYNIFHHSGDDDDSDMNKQEESFARSRSRVKIAASSGLQILCCDSWRLAVGKKIHRSLYHRLATVVRSGGEVTNWKCRNFPFSKTVQIVEPRRLLVTGGRGREIENCEQNADMLYMCFYLCWKLVEHGVLERTAPWLNVMPRRKGKEFCFCSHWSRLIFHIHLVLR